MRSEAKVGVQRQTRVCGYHLNTCKYIFNKNKQTNTQFQQKICGSQTSISLEQIQPLVLLLGTLPTVPVPVLKSPVFLPDPLFLPSSIVFSSSVSLFSVSTFISPPSLTHRRHSHLGSPYTCFLFLKFSFQ